MAEYFVAKHGSDQADGRSEKIAYADPISHDYRMQSDAPIRGKGPGGTDPGPFPYRDEVFFVSPTGDDGKAGTRWRWPGGPCRTPPATLRPGRRST